MFMKNTHILVTVAAAVLATACSSTPSNKSSSNADASTVAQPTAAPKTRMMKSRDGKYEGEVVGTAAPDAKFSKLVIGMETPEVQEVMGRTPDRSHTYESGKRWIPYYFGNDARRMQVLYKGEGCLIFTAGNIWGTAGGDLIQITFDPSGACYQQ
jgi:hypothetical protein